MAVNKLLVAFDESEGADRALAMAASLAAVNPEAHVDVVYVVPIPLLDETQMANFKDILDMMISDGEDLLAEAEQKVTEYVLRFTPEGVRPLLAGNTIGSDKKFLDHYMPNLMSHLHYRSVDVSTFKELARRWYPAVYENRPPKNGGHRALADIIESLDELRYYRKAFMAPAPGPDDAASKAIAADIVATSILNK